jgi:tetratricopeptide (TPR) repeat protein
VKRNIIKIYKTILADFMYYIIKKSSFFQKQELSHFYLLKMNNPFSEVSEEQRYIKKGNFRLIVGALLLVLLSVGAYFRNNVWIDEFTLWSDVVKKAPNNPRGLYNLALSVHHQNRYGDALNLLNKIIALNKQTWFVLSEIGAIYADMGLYDEAIRWQNEAIRLAKKPSEIADVLEFIGITYMKKGDKDAAMNVFLKAYSLNPDSATLNYHLGNIYYDIDIQQSLFYYERTIKISPDYYEAIINLANIYDDLGECEKALMLYRDAISKYPDAPEAYYNLGVFYERRGELDKAIEYYRKALSIDPNYPEPMQRLRILKIGTLPNFFPTH